MWLRERDRLDERRGHCVDASVVETGDEEDWGARSRENLQLARRPLRFPSFLYIPSFIRGGQRQNLSLTFSSTSADCSSYFLSFVRLYYGNASFSDRSCLHRRPYSYNKNATSIWYHDSSCKDSNPTGAWCCPSSSHKSQPTQTVPE